MHALPTPLAVGITEFKRNPGATLRRAKGAPVAVLRHNEPVFYVVQPEVMQRLADELKAGDHVALISSRRTSAAMGNTVDVSPDEL